jgi:hypothetical protein
MAANMTMLWIDHDAYFGPDRRLRDGGVRLFDRRRHNNAGQPPPLATALRQLYLRVLDARGSGRDAFLTRLEGTAMLAEMQDESDAAFELANLGMTLDRSCIEDARANIYATLDRAHALLRAA